MLASFVLYWGEESKLFYMTLYRGRVTLSVIKPFSVNFLKKLNITRGGGGRMKYD